MCLRRMRKNFPYVIFTKNFVIFILVPGVFGFVSLNFL